jgi:Tfp pilus assembly PilM family ATPase
MSIAKSPSPTMSVLNCGRCGHVNKEEAKFCGGCGQPIFEPCAKCAASVRLTQKFCGDCGADLEAILEKRKEDFQNSLAKTIEAAKNHEYGSAIEQLKRLSTSTDYRFEEYVQQARAALPKVEKLRQHVLQRTEEAQAVAMAAYEAGEHEKVIQALSSVPASLLDEPARVAFAKSTAFIEEVTSLRESLRDAVSKKDWPVLGSLLERALEIFPDDESYRNLASKVSNKLMAIAEALFAKGEYEDALNRMDSIPTFFQGDAFTVLKDRIAAIDWLVSQFDDEPFATPTLGKLAVRFTAEAPNDPRGKEFVAKISAILKEPRRDASIVYPHWSVRRESAIGGDLAIFGWPQSIDFSNQPIVRQNPARFGVAFGLALQALNASCFQSGFTQKKGLLSSLGMKRPTNDVWGIDIGTSHLKAVKLRREGEKLSVGEAELIEFPEVYRPGRDGKSFLAMREVVKELAIKHNWANAECWVNYPSREVFVRFIELPPVDNKKAMALLDAEAGGHFPVNLDELELLKWVADKSEREGTGRPSALIAARKYLVTQRWDFLTEVGLKAKGMQCEAIALMNLVWHEFKDLLDTPLESQSGIPAIAVIDSGATSTTLSVVASKRMWFRTIDGGGEELTLALARSAKVVRDVAERLKKSPHELTVPADQYAPLEEKLDAINHRMKQLVGEMLQQNRDVKIIKTLVTGGTVLGHGWIKRAICKH